MNDIDFLTLLTVMAVWVILCAVVLLALCPNYDDGWLGKIALGLIAVGCMATYIDYFEQRMLDMPPAVEMLIIGFAVLQIRHIWIRLPRLRGQTRSPA